MADDRTIAAIETRVRYLRNVAEAGDADGVRIQAAKIVEFAARLLAPPDEVAATPELVGPDPVPNNAMPSDTTYGAELTLEQFTKKYGRSPEQVYSEVVTGLLRPNPDRWAAFPPDEALYYLRDDRTRQQAVLDYFAGKVPFSAIAGYFGGWYADLGLVDLAAIHDLGATR